MVARAFIVHNARGNMRKILTIFFTAFLLSSCIQDDVEQVEKPKITNQELSATDFVKGSEDIPLLNNLEQIESDNVSFDSEAGSIASVDYSSSIDLEAVQEFYLKTLPQMGWKLTHNDLRSSRFTRDGEKLEIEFIEGETDADSDTAQNDDVVRFSLSSVVGK